MLQAGTTDRTTSDWLTHPITPEHIIKQYQRVMVARSREQCANNDYAKAFLRLCRINIVGENGVMLMCQSRGDDGKLDNLANEAIEAALADWGKRGNCDVTGTKSWPQLQRAAVHGLAKDGEFMFRKIYGRDAGPWGFALQQLDPQRCPPDFDQFDLADGAYIRAGIECNRYGRPLAFHFQVPSPSDAYYNYSYAGKYYHRIAAAEIIHGFENELGPGQLRGLPWIGTGLWSLKQLHGFEDAAIIAARTGASKMGVLQWREGAAPDEDDAPEANEFEMTAEPGEFPILPDGLELKDWNPQYPSGELQQQVKTMLRRFSAGTGAAYNNISGDLENVNFSSIRQGALDERESWKERQDNLIDDLHKNVFAEWLPRALLSGKITVKGRPLKAERLDRYSAVEWQPRRWDWIDPKSDVQAAVEAKNNLLDSPSRIIREKGRDPQTVYREISADIEQMKAAGIPEQFIMASLLGKQTQAATQAAGGAAKTTKE